MGEQEKFSTIEAISEQLGSNRYISDQSLATIIYLAYHLNKPLFLEGEPGVGKTSVILRFTDRAFKRTYLPTMGVNISEKIISHENDIVEYILWDVAGQAKFQLMRKHFYEGADAQILVFKLLKE